MIGNAVWEVFPELKGTIVEEEITKVLREHTIIQYEVYFPPDGRWYETDGYATRDGVILIFRDITSRKFKPA